MRVISFTKNIRPAETGAVLTSAAVALVSAIVFSATFEEIISLFLLQVVIAWLVFLVQSCRYSWWYGVSDVILTITFTVLAVQYIPLSYEYASVPLYIPVLFFLLGLWQLTFSRKIATKLEFAFLRSLLVRRIGVFLFGLIIWVFLDAGLPVLLAISIFVSMQTLFDLFVVTQRKEFDRLAKLAITYYKSIEQEPVAYELES